MTLPERVSDLMPFDLLLSVARLGSIGLAVERHGISQPAASTRIRRLERRLLAVWPEGRQLTGPAADLSGLALSGGSGASAGRRRAGSRPGG